MTNPFGGRRRVIYGAYPLTLLLSAGMAYALVRAGMSRELAALVTLPASVAFILFLEWFSPHRDEWTRPDGQLLNDLGHLAVSFGVGGIAGEILQRYTWYLLADALAPHSPLAIWPHGWPVAAQVALACVVGGFGDYWNHRAQHGWRWYWKCHVLHHSSKRLWVGLSWRQNMVDVALGGFMMFGPLILMGIGSEALFYYSIVGYVSAHLSHANIGERNPRWIDLLFAVPAAHRIHHSRVEAESSQNFGSFTLLWDHLFGTYADPRGREIEEGGISDPFPTSFLAQLAYPFRSQERNALALRGETPSAS